VAVARMIGGEAHSHEAHLALFELANSICSIRSPECATCPLKSDCQFVATNGYQALLPFTTPAA
jgi:adenine-specific DNA glycosylase